MQNEKIIDLNNNQLKKYNDLINNEIFWGYDLSDNYKSYSNNSKKKEIDNLCNFDREITYRE